MKELMHFQLSFIEKAYEVGSKLTTKLKEVIPQHLFEIPIQAAIGGKISQDRL